MILMTASPRRPSRLAFWMVLGLGALLLPLAPRAARTEAPEKAQGVEEKSQPESSGLRLPLANSQTKPLALDFGFPVAAPDRSEEIENLKDEIELLKLKVQLKEARRAGTQTRLKEVLRRYTVMQETNRRTPGSIPRDTLMEVWMTKISLDADAAVQEIEWKEAMVLLKQAERRLARLQRPATKTDSGDRAPEDKRLQELEQKVESLLKEIHKLRKDTRPNKPPAPDPEHEEARGFIDRVWPTLDTMRLEDNIPKARKAFQKCKAVGDRISLQKLLKGTKGHAERLAKELSELKPDIIIDDVAPAKKLQKVNEQILKLYRDIESTLNK